MKKSFLKHYPIFIAAVLMFAVPMNASAEEKTWDITTQLALIPIHKYSSGYLDSRQEMEGLVADEHDTTEGKTKTYKGTEKSLRKFYECMNLIIAIMAGGETVFNTIGTYRQIGEKVVIYTKLYKAYYENYLKKFKVEPCDLYIYAISKKTVSELYSEAQSLYSSYMDLAQFTVTSKTFNMEMSAAQFTHVLDNINSCYERIKSILDNGISMLYEYYMLRSGYFNRNILRPVVSKEAMAAVIHGCRDRWVAVLRKAHPGQNYHGDVKNLNMTLANNYIKKDREMDNKIEKCLNQMRSGH